VWETLSVYYESKSYVDCVDGSPIYVQVDRDLFVYYESMKRNLI
jgi:hypothetical protein